MWRIGSREGGFALITTAIASLVITLLVVALLAFATNSLPDSRRDQDWNASLAAADAGVDDYLARLNENINYHVDFGPSNTGGNQAFLDWVPVPGNPNEATFRYDTDISALASDGVVRLTSTGRVRGVTRSVQALLRRRTFIDYVYFTDYETKDPADYGSPGSSDSYTPAVAQSTCVKRYYEARPEQHEPTWGTAGCTRLQFIADSFDGPFHTNDAFRVLEDASPQFLASATTSWNYTSGPGWVMTDKPGVGSGTATPTFSQAGDPSFVPPLPMPPTNAALRGHADGALGGTGCMYTGPTRITLKPNGRMDVNSPSTTSTNPGCGGPFPAVDVALPANGVVYVRNVPTGDPTTCPAHPLGYPQAGDSTAYGCADGDVFLSGTLDGRLTIAAEKDIVVTGNVVYKGGWGTSSDDMLGLIANDDVEVYHPVRPLGHPLCPVATPYLATCNVAPFVDPEIHAAILTLRHTFRVQNSGVGAPMGTLRVRGAIAQKFRGLVGLNSLTGPLAGYTKDYRYDQRFKTQSPPRFLDPVQSSWRVAAWAELQAQHAP